MTYSLDTSTLIALWQIWYGREAFPEVWTLLDAAGQRGLVFLCREVKEEYREPELLAWLKNYLVRETGPAELAIVNEIMSHPNWSTLVPPDADREVADPYVIAHAKTTGGLVVTEEKRKRDPAKMKIPDVCDQLGLDCLSGAEFVRRLMLGTL